MPATVAVVVVTEVDVVLTSGAVVAVTVVDVVLATVAVVAVTVVVVVAQPPGIRASQQLGQGFTWPPRAAQRSPVRSRRQRAAPLCSRSTGSTRAARTLIAPRT